jgi:hypothetical protein
MIRLACLISVSRQQIYILFITTYFSDLYREPCDSQISAAGESGKIPADGSVELFDSEYRCVMVFLQLKNMLEEWLRKKTVYGENPVFTPDIGFFYFDRIYFNSLWNS